MHPELIQFLKNFQILTSEEIEIIAKETIIKEFEKGHILLKEGEVSKQLDFIPKELLLIHLLVL